MVSWWRIASDKYCILLAESVAPDFRQLSAVILLKYHTLRSRRADLGTDSDEVSEEETSGDSEVDSSADSGMSDKDLSECGTGRKRQTAVQSHKRAQEKAQLKVQQSVKMRDAISKTPGLPPKAAAGSSSRMKQSNSLAPKVAEQSVLKADTNEAPEDPQASQQRRNENIAAMLGGRSHLTCSFWRSPLPLHWMMQSLYLSLLLDELFGSQQMHLLEECSKPKFRLPAVSPNVLHQCLS